MARLPWGGAYRGCFAHSEAPGDSFEELWATGTMPKAAEIREQVAARSRAALEAKLDTDLAAGPPAEHLAHAEGLLADRAAAPLVAALLALLAPDLRAEPRDLASPRTNAEPRHSQRERGHDRGPGRPRGRELDKRATRAVGFERFFINWGVNQGATPSRLLAAICRRGEVTGGNIGSIAVHPNASTFDVSADVAERFERLAGRRDPRDPKTRIRRDRNPRAEARGRRS